MALRNWLPSTSGDFGTAANWTKGRVPGAKDIAALDNTGAPYTVSVSTSGFNVAAITSVAGNALSIGDGLVFTANRGTNGGTFSGAMQVGNGTIFVLGANTFSGISFNNAGTISLNSTGGNSAIRLNSPSATLSGGGTVNMNGPRAMIFGAVAPDTLTNADNTIVGTGFIGFNQMTLINGSKGVIEATGLLTVRDGAGHTLTNSGLMESNATGKLALVNETINQSGGGTLLATDGFISLQAVDIVGGTLTTTGAGRINVNGGGATIDGSTSAVTVSGLVQVTGHQTLTAMGSIANSGKVDVFNADLVVGGTGATLSGGGQLNLNNNSTNIITGATSVSTLDNVNNRIDGAGQLGNGSMTLINEAAGVIIGNQNIALTINTGANVITNAGLIQNVGHGGTVIDSAMVNTGILRAATAGTLTLAGLVTGAGVAQINGGTLFVEGAFGEAVSFTGSTGVLKLADSQDFTGSVSGLSKTGTNWLDLTDITFTAGVTKVSYTGTTAGGVLTVTDGTHTANINIVGNYSPTSFAVHSDGFGGSKVVDPTPATTLSSAMASFGANSGSGQGVAPHLASRIQPLMIAAR